MMSDCVSAGITITFVNEMNESFSAAPEGYKDPERHRGVAKGCCATLQIKDDESTFELKTSEGERTISLDGLYEQTLYIVYAVEDGFRMFFVELSKEITENLINTLIAADKARDEKGSESKLDDGTKEDSAV